MVDRGAYLLRHFERHNSKELPDTKALGALVSEKRIRVLAVRVEEEKALKCRNQHLGPACKEQTTHRPRGGLGLPHRWEGSLRELWG